MDVDPESVGNTWNRWNTFRKFRKAIQCVIPFSFFLSFFSSFLFFFAYLLISFFPFIFSHLPYFTARRICVFDSNLCTNDIIKECLCILFVLVTVTATESKDACMLV